MIALEIITLAAALVTVMVAVSQIQTNILHRTKLEHGLDILDIAKKLNCDAASFNSLIKPKVQALCAEQQTSFSTAKFIWRILFGVVVLTGFSCLSANLFKEGLSLWGIIAAIFAVIGLIMLVITWTAKKQFAAIAEQINNNLATYTPAAATTPAAAAVETAKPAESPKTVEVKTERVTAPAEIKPAAAPAKPVSAAAPCTYKPRIPTDSILKRHFISHIRSQIEAEMCPRPTDSILKRHYDHLLENKLAMALTQMEC